MENNTENKNLWFRAKRYGWGWTPATWQGWLIILAYIAGIIVIASHAVVVTDTANGTAKVFLWNYLPPLAGLTIILIWICYKTGEKPGWRWGEK